MSLHLVIDGYNVINKWPRLIKAKQKSMELAQEELFNIVQRYCDYNDVEAAIIYDGNRSERTIEGENPKIIFSQKGESADDIIESLVYQAEDKSSIRVVTDDRMIGNMIIGMGAFTMSVTSFAKEIGEK